MGFIVAAATTIALVPILVKANPFYTGTGAKSALASTTQMYIRPGLATSTLPIYDSYEQGGTNQTNSSNLTIPNTVAVLLQGFASSTASVVNAKCEFSDNYNPATGLGDWFDNEIYSTPATTTNGNPFNIGTAFSYQFTYASSTQGGAIVTPLENKFAKLVTCPVPLRFVRVVVSATGGNSSLWAAIIPTKQRN